MGVGERKYDASGPDDATVMRGALGAVALAVVKSGRAEEISRFLKRHMTGINPDNPGSDLALKVYEEAMDAIALHVRRSNPTGGKKAGDQ